MRAVHPGRVETDTRHVCIQTVQCWISWYQVLTPLRELYRHNIHDKMSHGTQEESIHWTKRKKKGHKSLDWWSWHCSTYASSHPNPRRQLWDSAGNWCWHPLTLGRGRRMCRACFKGSGSKAAWTHSCRKLFCCLPAMHTGEAVVLAQGPYEWIQCNRVLRGWGQIL